VILLEKCAVPKDTARVRIVVFQPWRRPTIVLLPCRWYLPCWTLVRNHPINPLFQVCQVAMLLLWKLRSWF